MSDVKRPYCLVSTHNVREEQRPSINYAFGTDFKRTRKCVYETLCPQLVSHFQDVKMSKK